MRRRQPTEGERPVPGAAIRRVVADLKGLPRPFWLLSAGTFVYLIGVEMTYPYETLYLNGQLGISMTTLGLIIGITLLATLPLQVVGGALCDRIGRRPVLIVAILGSMTLYGGLALSTDLTVIVALIAFEAAFGWAQFITASNAIIADVTTMEQRTEAFSVSRVALNAGIAIGPLVALPLLARDPTFRLNFVMSAVLCAGFLVIVLVWLRETRPAGVQAGSVFASFRGYGAVLGDRVMLAFCLLALLPNYAFGQIWATMPVMLSDLHGVTAERWSVAMIVYGLCMVALQYPIIRILGRRDLMLLMSLSCLAQGAGIGAAAFVPWPATLACIAAIALGIVLLIPIASTVVSRLAPVELRGRYMGVWTLIYMGGYAMGPLLGGWALDTLGGRASFALTAAVCVLGALLFPLLRSSVNARVRATESAATNGVKAGDTLGADLVGERPEQAL
jgi:MFS family permease